jgi:hypothetical protein
LREVVLVLALVVGEEEAELCIVLHYLLLRVAQYLTQWGQEALLEEVTLLPATMVEIQLLEH